MYFPGAAQAGGEAFFFYWLGVTLMAFGGIGTLRGTLLLLGTDFE